MEEQRFQRIVDANYKSKFYSQIYEKQNKALTKTLGRKTQLINPTTYVDNLGAYYRTTYGQSYGKEPFEEL